ncbi:MAG: hypothetical protein ACOYBK_04685 [Bilifractor sp.]|nr:hypothetical protein [Lachnospiraceae bacterium]
MKLPLQYNMAPSDVKRVEASVFCNIAKAAGCNGKTAASDRFRHAFI